MIEQNAMVFVAPVQVGFLIWFIETIFVFINSLNMPDLQNSTCNIIFGLPFLQSFQKCACDSHAVCFVSFSNYCISHLSSKAFKVFKKTLLFLRWRVNWIWVWSPRVDMVCFSPAHEVWCIADVSSFSPSSGQTILQTLRAKNIQH